MRRLGAAIGLAFALALALAQTANADGVDRSYPVGDQPGHIAIDPNDGRLYVANRFSSPGSVSVIEPASGDITLHSTSGTPRALALDAVHRRLYVGNYNATFDVFAVPGMTLLATLPVYGVGIAVDTATQRVYVAGQTALTVIDGATNTVATSRPALADEDWYSVALDPS